MNSQSVSSPTPEHSSQPLQAVFRISPIIRVTLGCLYVALILPLPFLAQAVDASVSPILLWVGMMVGAIALYAALSEQVKVDETGIQVGYPGWVPNWFRRGWFLPWDDVKALKPKTTGQGGLVYYFLSQSGEGFLLPMRIAGFAKLVRIVQQKTGIDTTDVRPLSQPWMYIILFGFTVFLLLIDLWTITTAINPPLP